MRVEQMRVEQSQFEQFTPTHSGHLKIETVSSDNNFRMFYLFLNFIHVSLKYVSAKILFLIQAFDQITFNE